MGRVTAAVSNRNANELRSLTTEFQQSSPFLYSLMHDTLRVAIILCGTFQAALSWSANRKRTDELLQTIAVQRQRSRTGGSSRMKRSGRSRPDASTQTRSSRTFGWKPPHTTNFTPISRSS